MKFCLVDQELGLNIFRKVLENILPFVIKHLASMLVFSGGSWYFSLGGQVFEKLGVVENILGSHTQKNTG